VVVATVLAGVSMPFDGGSALLKVRSSSSVFGYVTRFGVLHRCSESFRSHREEGSDDPDRHRS
jgi:hypothetical protein